MRPYGFQRTYAKCRVVRAGFSRKIKVTVFVKSHKRARKAPLI